MSKGSRPRPLVVSQDEFAANWQRAFACPRCNGAGVVGGVFFGYHDARLIPEPVAYEERPCPRCCFEQPSAPELLDDEGVAPTS